MKTLPWILAALLLACPACKKEQTAGEKIKGRVDDALNRRPNEELRDAVEDAQDAAVKVVDEAKKAVEDATKEKKGK